MIALALLLVAAAQLSDDPVLRDIEQQEWSLERAFVNETYRIGSSYMQAGYRQEACWMLTRTSELVPKNPQVRNLVRLLQDYDNPIWAKRDWKKAKGAVASSFRKEVKAWEEECSKIYFEMGKYAGAKKGDAAHAKALDYFLRLLRITGPPFEVGPDKKLKAGKSRSIPEPFSAELLRDHFVRINDRLYERDAMLRAIPDIASVREARSDRFTVRMVGPSEKANDLLRLMEQAYDRYCSFTGRMALRSLGLLVFPDRAAYEKFCDASDNALYRRAHGFALNGAGFAVTFDQPDLEEIAVHEAAHLFHASVYRSNMPSWYDEGFACTFGATGTMRMKDGVLETGLPLAKWRLEALAKKTPPLKDLLNGSAVERINAADGSDLIFYAHGWALYNFLDKTKDPRFAPRFAEWESFTLGAGYEKKGPTTTTPAADLFEKLFGPALPDLERALNEWIAQQAAAPPK